MTGLGGSRERGKRYWLKCGETMDLRIPLSASILCPYCGQHTKLLSSEASAAMFPVQMAAAVKGLKVGTGANYVVSHDGDQWWIGVCHACDGVVLVKNSGETVYPTPQPRPVSDQIPEPMRSHLREAKHCLEAGARNAAVVMARRALQCAAVEQGAPGTDPLWKQIKWLDDNRKITPQQRRWADAARWVGNEGAHDAAHSVAGQPVVTGVSKEDATETIRLVEHLFETLYVASKVAQQQLAKRGKAVPPGGA